MKKNYSHITLIIDRSGSMRNVWSDVKGGYSEFVKQNKEAEGEATFSFYNFDDVIEKTCDFTNIQDVNEDLDFKPRNWTSLYDALGKAINETGESLNKMKEEDRPEKVLVIVQTDGYENSSSEFDAKTVKKMIETQEKEYNWEFLFLGAGMEFLNQASDVGLGDTYVGYSKTKMASAFFTAGEKIAQTRCAMMLGENAADLKTFSYTEKEKEELLKE